MKIIYSIFFLLISLSLSAQQDIAKNYSIYFPAEFPADAKTDVVDLLSRATGSKWKLVPQNEVKAGFIIVHTNNSAFKTNESFRIQSNGSSKLIISSFTTEGLVYGIYSQLRKLGFKFYLPDELYTIIPSVKNPFGNKRDVIDQPFLQIRNFFGTGGFGSGLSDPGESVKITWNLWKLRNGFGSAYGLSGHRGENFILENKDRLEKHPEWLVSPLIKNGQLDITAKLNYLDKNALDYYTDWTIQPLKNNPDRKPSNTTEFVSVEPSDGGGYRNDWEPGNKQLPSVSDQVFGAANLAASKLDKVFPGNPNIGVNLYAYSTHAEPPSFKLHPRVFVQLIPYQFQNIAYGPAFIKRWSGKAKRFGLYDYFKYPDNSWDMPAMYPIEELMNRARYAARAGSEGTTYESSYSKFATAIPLWILVQYMNSGDPNWEKNFEQLIIDLYGNAAPAIKKLFGLFYRESQFSSSHLQAAIQYIGEAEKQNKNTTVTERINELKLYLAYVHLYLSSQNEKNGNLEQRYLPLEKMAWTLYEKKILHSYRIMQLVSYVFLNANPPDADLAKHYNQIHLLTFPETSEPNAFWKKNDYRYSPTEFLRLYNNITVEKNSSPPVFNTIPISELIAASKISYIPKKNIIIRGDNLVRGYFTLFTEKSWNITINWKLTNQKGDIPTATVSGSNTDYSSVYDYPLKGSSGKISVFLPAGESSFFIHSGENTAYNLQMELSGVYCYFYGSPRGKMVFPDEKGNHTYNPPVYPCYFYVPENINELKYKVQLNALQIIFPNGTAPVKTDMLENMYGGWEIRSFIPPASQKGKFWKAVITGNYDYEMLNIPDVYFLLQEKGQ